MNPLNDLKETEKVYNMGFKAGAQAMKEKVEEEMPGEKVPPNQKEDCYYRCTNEVCDCDVEGYNDYRNEMIESLDRAYKEVTE